MRFNPGKSNKTVIYLAGIWKTGTSGEMTKHTVFGREECLCATQDSKSSSFQWSPSLRTITSSSAKVPKGDDIINDVAIISHRKLWSSGGPYPKIYHRKLWPFMVSGFSRGSYLSWYGILSSMTFLISENIWFFTLKKMKIPSLRFRRIIFHKRPKKSYVGQNPWLNIRCSQNPWF